MIIALSSSRATEGGVAIQLESNMTLDCFVTSFLAMTRLKVCL